MKRLFDAVIKGNTDIVRRLLEAGADPGAHDKYGNSLLYLACEERHPAIVRLLLEAGADVNDGNSENDETPLHVACEQGNSDIITMLFDRKDCEINAMDDRRRTPLYMACENGCATSAQMLLEKDADKDIRDDRGLSPLDRALGMGSERVEGGRVNQNGSPRVWWDIFHVFRRTCPEYLLNYTIKLPPDNPHREEIIDLFRQHHPELVLEAFCATGLSSPGT